MEPALPTVEAPKEEVEAPKEEVEAPKEEVEAPKEEVEASPTNDYVLTILDGSEISPELKEETKEVEVKAIINFDDNDEELNLPVYPSELLSVQPKEEIPKIDETPK